jgi:hypothetical protein
MTLSAFVQNRLVELLNERRIVVWYDGEHAFEEFVQSFKAPSWIVISAAGSTLKARRRAETIYRNMKESENLAQAQANLLIAWPNSAGFWKQRSVSGLLEGRDRGRRCGSSLAHTFSSASLCSICQAFARWLDGDSKGR